MSEHPQGPHSSGNISIDAEGNVWEYVPPNMVKIVGVTQGPTVSYGPTETLVAGDALAPGIWRVIGAGLEAVGEVQVQPVTITEPPAR